MTSISNTVGAPIATTPPGVVTRVFGAFLDIVSAIPQAARSAQDFERLSNLSNAELARMGLRREDVARHALRTHPRD